MMYDSVCLCVKGGVMLCFVIGLDMLIYVFFLYMYVCCSYIILYAGLQGTGGCPGRGGPGSVKPPKIEAQKITSSITKTYTFHYTTT